MISDCYASFSDKRRNLSLATRLASNLFGGNSAQPSVVVVVLVEGMSSHHTILRSVLMVLIRNRYELVNRVISLDGGEDKVPRPSYFWGDGDAWFWYEIEQRVAGLCDGH